MNRIAHALVFGFAAIVAAFWFLLSTIAPHKEMALLLGVVFQFISSLALIQFLRNPGDAIHISIQEERRNARSTRAL